MILMQSYSIYGVTTAEHPRPRLRTLQGWSVQWSCIGHPSASTRIDVRMTISSDQVSGGGGGGGVPARNSPAWKA